MTAVRVGARAALTPQMLRTGIYGTPEECAKQLEVVVEAGFNHISIRGPLGRARRTRCG